MPNTLTAAADNATGVIHLSIEHTGAIHSVFRFDAINGERSVRLPEGVVFPSVDVGSLILDDYEAVHGVNFYTVNLYNSTTGAVTVLQASATLTVDEPWLSVPVMPQYSERVDLITNYSSTRDISSTVHRPIGRDDALVVMGRMGDRSGTLEVWCRDYATVRKVERVFSRGEVVQLRQRVPELDMYFTALRLPAAPVQVSDNESGTRWSLSVDYVEVRRPLGPLAGALGWTFDELTLAYSSFDAVASAFTDLDALTLGDTIA
jgi:hypothetical protein